MERFYESSRLTVCEPRTPPTTKCVVCGLMFSSACELYAHQGWCYYR